MGGREAVLKTTWGGRSHFLAAAWAVLLSIPMAAAPAAQSAGGAIVGRVTDAQAAGIPGATITARNAATGLTRSAITDRQGLYQLQALPVGRYDVVAALAGFKQVDRRDIEVTVSRTESIDFQLEVAPVAETVVVTGGLFLVRTVGAGVGEGVDLERIQGLPLNGRQFGNLAATLPGVGLAFHEDPTKGDQYAPLIAGGQGRSVNYQVDGGDNTDDTVGGLLQLFPLEAIQEFTLLTNGSSAEYGRSAGAVMNIVTKAGGNRFAGSWFTLFRDDALNARTTTEKASAVEKPAYRRWQYGGSAGGPIVRDRLHYFAAFERTEQNTFQAVTSDGLFPELDGVFPIERRDNLLHVKGTWNTGEGGYLAVRYGRSTSTVPDGVAPKTAPPSWGTSRNSFDSVNVNYTRTFGRSVVNEVLVQYADFANRITANSVAPTEFFPNGVVIGQSPTAPQATEQAKWQVRDDVSWQVSGLGGLGHAFKAGINVVHEPILGVPALGDLSGGSYAHLTDDVDGPLTRVTSFQADPASGSERILNVPLRHFGIYVQDDWRVHPRLTLSLGVRYDLSPGVQIDQSQNPNFVVLQQAGREGRFTNVQGFESYGQTPREDSNNVQPRLGAVLVLDDSSRSIIRGTWGIYHDFSYTNANLLFAAFDAHGVLAGGTLFVASDPNGLRNPDGSFFRRSDPISNIAALNEATGEQALNGEILSPRFQQPFTRRASVGFSYQVGASAVASIDYVRDDGRDLSMRPALNTRVNGGARRFADLAVSPANFRIAISEGRSQYDAMILNFRRRGGALDLAASYTLARAVSSGGSSVDGLGLGGFIQDATVPFAPVQLGPSRGDARHSGNVSAILSLGRGFTVATILLLRSALPVPVRENLDLNRDGALTEIGTVAFRYDGGRPPVEIGPCRTVNCGRGAGFAQLNLRVSRQFAVAGTMRIEALVEVFNLLDTSNPTGFDGRRFLGPVAQPQPNPAFMTPSAYAGDFRQPEQRVGQVGFRVTF